jgi:pentatricopeptide repeat protein
MRMHCIRSIQFSSNSVHAVFLAHCRSVPEGFTATLRHSQPRTAMAALGANLGLSTPSSRSQLQRPLGVVREPVAGAGAAPASVTVKPASGWVGYGSLLAILEPVLEARRRSKEETAEGSVAEESGSGRDKVNGGSGVWRSGGGRGNGRRRLGKLNSKRGQSWDSGLTEKGEELLRKILLGDESVSDVLTPAQGSLCCSELLSIIKGLGREGQWIAALAVFDWMRERPMFRPDGVTIAVMLRILGRESQLTTVSRLFETLKLEGYPLDVYAYTSLITSLSRNRKFKEALEFFKQMKEEGPQPNIVTYNVIIDLYGKKGRSWEKILEVFEEMRAQGIRPDEYTYNTAITACASGSLCEEAKELFTQMKASNCTPDRVTYNALLDVYGKAGWHHEAANVLKEMESAGCPPNIVTYNELLSAFGRAGLYNAAAEMKESMVCRGIEPDVFTYTSLLSAYSRAGRVEQATEIYEEMRRKNCTPNSFTFNALIDMHGKNKNFNEMMLIFEDMQVSGRAFQFR